MERNRRSYADPCGVARSLDAIGERWALLVVRELSLGPRRFGQLRAGLPDISPNVLSQRLQELEGAGVARRYELDPPAGTTVYELTDRGYALDPVLQALGRWGARQPAITSREMSATSLLRSLRVLVRPDAPDVTYGLDLAGEHYAFTITDGSAEVARRRPVDATATLIGDVSILRLIVFLGTGVRAAEESGALVVTGDRRAAARFPGLFRVPSS